MTANVSSQVQSTGSSSSRKRRPMMPAAARKPTAKQIPNVWIVSGPTWMCGSTRQNASCPLRGSASEVAQRVHDRAVDAHLEVQVRAEAETGAAGQADDLALADVLADARLDRRLVPVARRHHCGVLDAGVVAVAAFPAGDDHVA